jgi:Copper transport outer membrane protein, MctB
VIDFRFFLISIIAVFLSLGVGIVIGSGFFGDPIINAIEGQVEDVLERDDRFRQEISDLEQRRNDDQDALSALEARTVGGKLVGDDVVIVSIEGTDGQLIPGVRRTVEAAGGTVAWELTMTDKLALEDPEARADLAGVMVTLGVDEADAGSLRTMLGQELGARLGAASRPPAAGGRRDPETRFQTFISDLAEAEFISVDQDPIVPDNAGFVIAAGSATEPGWPAGEVIEAMGLSLAPYQSPVLVAETSDSLWDVTGVVRGSDEASAVVSTVDNAETAAGRISVALALDLSPGSIGHWGTGDGVQGPVPTPPG